MCVCVCVCRGNGAEPLTHAPCGEDCLALCVLEVAPLRGSSGILGRSGCSVGSRIDGSAVGPACDVMRVTMQEVGPTASSCS